MRILSRQSIMSILLCLFFCTTSFIAAQSKKYITSFQSGYVFPYLPDKSWDYRANGYEIEGNFGIQLRNFIQLTGTVAYGYAPFDVEAYQRGINYTVAPPERIDVSAIETLMFTTGVRLMTELKPSPALFISGDVGIFLGSIPDIELIFRDHSMMTEGKTSMGTMYRLGIGLLFYLTQSINFLIEGNFSSLRFPGEKLGNFRFSETKSLRSFSINPGLEIKF